MKLCATIQSERGKTIQKTGNDFLQIQLSDENNIVFGSIHVYPQNLYVFCQIHGKTLDAITTEDERQTL